MNDKVGLFQYNFLIFFYLIKEIMKQQQEVYFCSNMTPKSNLSMTVDLRPFKAKSTEYVKTVQKEVHMDSFEEKI